MWGGGSVLLQSNLQKCDLGKTPQMGMSLIWGIWDSGGDQHSSSGPVNPLEGTTRGWRKPLFIMLILGCHFSL